MTDSTELAGLEARQLALRATRVRYYAAGRGEPVALVHGLGGAAANWVDLAPLLAARFRVVVPELPGHGGSTPLPAVPNLNGLADSVEGVLNREAARPAIVVGHSLGGLVALRLALRHPGAVRGLVLVSAAGITSTTRRAKLALDIVAIVRPARRLARYADAIAASRPLRRIAFGIAAASDPVALSPTAARGFLAPARLHTDTISAANALVRDDPRPDLARLSCPALVIGGARDEQIPVGDCFEYARRLGAPLRIVADCGHLLIGERPDACFDAVTAFADRLA